MARALRLPLILLRALTLVFAAVSLLYGGAWMYYVRTQSASAEFGFVAAFSPAGRVALVEQVEAGGPADGAGLRVGDRIVAINGRLLMTMDRYARWDRARATDVAALTVQRPQQPPRRLVVRLSEAVPFSLTGLVRASLLEVLTFYPVIFLGVGLAVLVMRPQNPYAWLMAALFASFLAVPQFPRAISGLSPGVGTFVLAYRSLALPAIPALFYGFFALFPVRSPMDRHLPWLKWLNVAGWALFSLPNLRAGGPASSELLRQVFGAEMAEMLRWGYLLAGIPMGVMALVWSALTATDPDARRKTRVLLWGTVLGVLPVVIQSTAQILLGWEPSWWVSTGSVLMASIFPASFAYAVVKHQVLDIPVLLRRSARYVLVRRGFSVLLLGLVAVLTALLALALSTVFHVNVTVATAAGVVFGLAMAAGLAPVVRKATRQIDRAFFRSAYDATEILENLPSEIRATTGRAELGQLLESKISEALHPLFMAVYLQNPDGLLHPYAARWPSALPEVAIDLPWLVELARRGKPWDVSQRSMEDPPEVLRASPAECLVPMLGRTGRLIGYLLLGARASDEPYATDDARLLASVAAQAGIELDNIGLAEAMAERLDRERTAEREMEIARQVQARLFPQRVPPLAHLDYAGGCLQARNVGGDYFDVIPGTPGRVGLVVADISGKGMAAALLMANLQANLRSQYRVDADDLSGLLGTVNRLFYDSTAENQYATLFFADYHDASRTIRYANCGHFPPYVVHPDGAATPLMPTATVLGLFEAWSAETAEVTLGAHDTVVIYTDGIIEALGEDGEEFGVERLLEVVRSRRDEPAAAVVAAVHEAVQGYCGGAAGDDLTVVVLRGR